MIFKLLNIHALNEGNIVFLCTHRQNILSIHMEAGMKPEMYEVNNNQRLSKVERDVTKTAYWYCFPSNLY